MCRDIDNRVMELCSECLGETNSKKKVLQHVDEISVYLFQLGIMKLLVCIPSVKEISKGIYVSSNGLIRPDLVQNMIMLGEKAGILYINPGKKVIINFAYSSLI